MIPPYCSEHTRSSAEIKVFEIFQDIGIDATVLHSLGMADHRDKVFGEIDFVVICKQGILCLEVKGGFISREQGVWIFENRDGKVTRKEESPFQQVVGNMFSLRNHLGKILGYHHPILKSQFACGVIFPDMTFTRKGIDIIPEIIFDNRNRDSDMVSYIDQVFNYWKKKIREKHDFIPEKLNGNMITQLETILRGDFSCIPSISNIVNEIDRRLVQLTTEQFDTFRMVSDNPRLIVKGRAGTGKTLIAMEQAKRWAISGKRVLYLCYNRLISSYLNNQMARDSKNIEGSLEVTNFHELLSRFVSFDDASSYTSDLFYSQIVPERFLEHVSSNEIDKYDVMFIDEGQDLLRANYLLCIDELLHQGLKDGNWYLFYDDNQNIYNPAMEEGLRLLEELKPARTKLMVNCRNTQQIATYNKLLTGFEQGEVIKINGEQVNRTAYQDSSDMQGKLVSLVKAFIKQGIKPGEIVILSPYSLKNSGLGTSNTFSSICRFQDISGMKYNTFLEDSLKFCTIQSFKGMESKVVILIDLDKFMDNKTRKLNYTAISRARVLLHILYHAEAEDEINQIARETIQGLLIS
ncbi:NERD domain-containing protein [Brevibacillus centrosporus]|uniref:nuclease-related domain-containing DEAD/DEAH box helicase n=1 Tax=Brevibacillus centrosporus TaxID=54910 RepID=UPI003B0230E9